MQVRRGGRWHWLVGSVPNDVGEQDLRRAHGRVGLDVAKLLSKRVVVLRRLLLRLLGEGVLGGLPLLRLLGHAVGRQGLLADHATARGDSDNGRRVEGSGDAGAGAEHAAVDVVDGGGACGGPQRRGVGHNTVQDAALGLVLAEVAEARVDRGRLGEDVHRRLRPIALVRLVLWLLLHGGAGSGGRLVVVAGRLGLAGSGEVGCLWGCLHSLEAMKALEVRGGGRRASSSPCLNKLRAQEMGTC